MRTNRLSALQHDLRMDSVEEIMANKITTLASRSEIRDIVDLYFLEQSGYRVEEHLENALRKDAGATPATIAWLLSTLRVPERIPGDAPRAAIVGYVRDPEARLRKHAFPA